MQLVKVLIKKMFNKVVQQAAEDMDLTLHFKKRAGNLSGGNKRKLVI